MQSSKRCSADSMSSRHKGQDESMVGQSVVCQQFRVFRMPESHLVMQRKAMLGASLHPPPPPTNQTQYRHCLARKYFERVMGRGSQKMRLVNPWQHCYFDVYSYRFYSLFVCLDVINEFILTHEYQNLFFFYEMSTSIKLCAYKAIHSQGTCATGETHVGRALVPTDDTHAST